MSWHHWNDGNWIRATITNSGTIQVGEKTFLVEYVCICVCIYIYKDDYNNICVCWFDTVARQFHFTFIPVIRPVARLLEWGVSQSLSLEK